MELSVKKKSACTEMTETILIRIFQTSSVMSAGCEDVIYITLVIYPGLVVFKVAKAETTNIAISINTQSTT